MNATGLKRKDTTRGPPLRILSLDGGGVRGYSMLILLQELMYRTYVEIEGKAPRRHEIPKPCDHFDLIAGTGTGGLIAIMLGRLRLDIETCKDLYVRMTKRVFETDKTIAGIPYRSTLFKASKLEDAIRECVQEHTIDESEGNDSSLHPNTLHSPSFRRPERSLSNVSRYSQIGASGPNMRTHGSMLRLGNPNALFYDCRDNRTKTAVTAVYKGTPKNGKPVLLRSYDSRAEPAPEFDCKIWEAGRATCATGLAFKPIQIGQSVFIDEGVGKYNPAPQVLDEAVCKEWPGREVGVIVSVGTGKRPGGTNHQQHLWWEGFVSSNIGDFAEARRRLVAKIEGCEETHQLMLKEHLSKRNVLADNYYRLNVEVGVGEFGMNEWNRLAEISTNTRMYLSRTDVQQLNAEAAAKIAKIHKAKLRWERMDSSARIPDAQPYPQSFSEMAVELPSEEVMPPPSKSPAEVPTSQSDQITNLQHGFRTSTPNNVYNRLEVNISPRGSVELVSPVRASNELQGSEPPSSSGSFDPSSRRSADLGQDLTINPNQPPPLPPKGPIRQGNGLPPLPPTPQSASHGHTKIPLPYPDTDGPPPIINLARKPNLSS